MRAQFRTRGTRSCRWKRQRRRSWEPPGASRSVQVVPAPWWRWASVGLTAEPVPHLMTGLCAGKDQTGPRRAVGLPVPLPARPRPPPAARPAAGGGERVVEGDVRGAVAGQQRADLLVRARLPQRAQQPGDGVRVVEGGVGGGIAGQQRGDLRRPRPPPAARPAAGRRRSGRRGRRARRGRPARRPGRPRPPPAARPAAGRRRPGRRGRRGRRDRGRAAR